MANAQSRVELIVDAVKALNPLRKVKNETKQLEQAVRGAQNNIRGFNRQLRDTGSAAKSASTGVNNLGRAIRGLLAGFTAIQAARFVIFKTAELETQTRSLQVLTGSLDNAKSIIAELQAFGAVTPFTSSELIETAKRLKAFGFETEKIVDVTKRLSDVAGATGADLGGIATAFGQIQAKGRLQGEELLQLQERGVDIAGVLRKEYKLSADEFRKALESGRIGADAVNFALEKLTETGGKYAGGAIAQSDTLSGKFSTLVDGVENIARVVGTVLSPAIKAILDQAIGAINSVNQLINIGKRAQQFGLTQQQRTKILRQAEEEAKELALIRGGGKLDPALFNQLKLQREKDLIEQYGYKTGQIIPEATTPAVAAASAPPALPNQPLPTGTGGGDKKAGKFQMPGFAGTGIDPALAAEQAFAQQVVQISQGNMLLQARLEGGEKEEQQRQRISQIIEQSGITDKERVADAKRTLQAVFDQTNALEEQARLNEKNKQLFESIGATIKDGIVDTIMAAIDGSKSLGESLTGILKQIGGAFLEAGIGQLGQGLKIPGFANGGSIPGGKPAIVGERGPELFVPGRSGSIIPNDALGGAGNITVNVDASGSTVEGNADQANQLGKAIGIAVQQELIKQKRPGGLLAGV